MTVINDNKQLRKDINEIIYNTSIKCQTDIRDIWKKCIVDFNKFATFDTEKLVHTSCVKKNKLDIIQDKHMLSPFLNIVKDRCKQIETDFYRTSNYNPIRNPKL